MLLNSFYTVLGKFYTLLNNTDLDLSYFDLGYVFPGHSDSVEQGLTGTKVKNVLKLGKPPLALGYQWVSQILPFGESSTDISFIEFIKCFILAISFC